MDKDTLIARARAVEDRDDLLALLNDIKADMLGDKSYPFSPKQLRRCSNPNITAGRYSAFYIPKKSGAMREINAPRRTLKWFQICLYEVLKALYTPRSCAMGFVPGRSIVDNAVAHTNQNYVFNIDLRDFFPSIDQARVWKRLQLPPFDFNANIASAMAGICAIKIKDTDDTGSDKARYVLPQGAPTSPLLTNAVCDTLDRRLQGLAKRFGLHYSRYADDITFSSMHNVYAPGSDFRQELERIITGQRFTINESKTRLCRRSQRQEVTGLTVSSKINVTRRYVKDLRALLHIWQRYGLDAAFAAFYPRYKSEKCQMGRGEPNLENVIAGKLCYLRMVKGEKDPVYAKLAAQFSELTGAAHREVAADSGSYLSQLPWYPIGDSNYLMTMSLKEFEDKYGVTITFATSKNGKPYGRFTFQDHTFIVAISKNIDVDHLSADAQISLTRMPDRSRPAAPGEPENTHAVYLIHKPYVQKPPVLTDVPLDVDSNGRKILMTFGPDDTAFGEPTDEELESTARTGGLFSLLGFSEQSSSDLLDVLADSDFDLSILP